MKSTHSRWLALLLLLGVGACAGESTLSPTDLDSDGAATDDDEEPTDEQAESDSEQTDSDVEPAPSSVAQCDVPEFEVDTEAAPFEELRGSVVDEDGVGIPDVMAQACGVNVCIPGFTDDVGYIVHQRNPAAEMRRAALKYGDGVEYAQFALLLGEGAEHDVGEQATVRFPPVDRADPFAAGTTVSSGDIELTPAADANIKIDVLTFPDEENHRFVAAEMAPAVWPDAVPADEGVGMLIALGPLKTEFCPPAALSVPNSPGWEAGASVELLLHVTDGSTNQWGLYGEWGVVGTATVSADGERIETDEDSGVPQLGAIALRLAE